MEIRYQIALLALDYVQWELCKSVSQASQSRVTSIAILNILFYLLQWLISLLLLMTTDLSHSSSIHCDDPSILKSDPVSQTS